jgi:imidazole glycerol-phosphate synthase subunit HisH
VIGIIDYGAGNLTSVRNAFEEIGVEARIFDTPGDTAGFDRLILPGVGSFAQAMAALDARDWPSALRSHVDSGRPLLGICLGMQLLFDRGEEHGTTAGLGMVGGSVVPLRVDASCKVPHVGWNNLSHVRGHPLFAGVKPQVDFYFVHSFQCVPDDPGHIIAECQYGQPFAASVARGNVAGVQFHPEKSQPAGLRILQNFAGWDGGC